MKSTFYEEQKTKDVLCEFIQKTNRLSMGKKCLEFEKKFAKYQGRKHAIFFNSGSSANLALLASIRDIGNLYMNDEVAFSAVTWATNVMPIIQNNFTPVPIDVNIDNLNMCEDQLATKIKQTNIKVVFLTNLLGFSSNIKRIAKLCKKHNIILLEDNCESLGSIVDKKKLGNFGLASTFSFFVGHHLSTIEGGMVCTDNAILAEALRMTRAHGWSRDVQDETLKNNLKVSNYISDFHENYTFYALGYNLRPTELNAVIGLEQLKYIEQMNNKREENFQIFSKCIKRNKDISRFNLTHMDFVSNFAFPVLFNNEETMRMYACKFRDAGVEVRPIVGGNIVAQPFFNQHRCGHVYPNADKIANCGFYLPNNPELTVNEIKVICELLK